MTEPLIVIVVLGATYYLWLLHATPRPAPAWSPGPAPAGWQPSGGGWVLESDRKRFCFVSRWPGFLRLSIRESGVGYLFEGNLRSWSAIEDVVREHQQKGLEG